MVRQSRSFHFRFFFLSAASSSASSVAAGGSAPPAVVAFGAAFFALDLALALVRRADEGPVHADGLTQQVAAIQRLHGRLSLFVRLVLYQRVTWGKRGVVDGKNGGCMEEIVGRCERGYSEDVIRGTGQ